VGDAPGVRRAEKAMPDARARQILAAAHAGRLATVGADGWPYVVPLLHVVLDGEIWVHNTRARGHLRANVDHEPRACFEVDVPGEVFPYGRFECDTSIAYQSVVAFGRIRVVEAEAEKRRFFDALMAKYAAADWDRPQGFYPRLDQVTVYAIAVERLTGKETPLPPARERWPAEDRTKSPSARP
jgi:hypothetical protein